MKCLCLYLNETKLLYEYQSDFRSKFCTETVLIDVTEYIINGFESGELVSAVILDLKKILDTVNSKILTIFFLIFVLRFHQLD